MKAVLKLAPHTEHPGDCVEVWWAGEMIGVVYGADGPGIRFVSKHVDEQTTARRMGERPGVVEIRLADRGAPEKWRIRE